MTNLKNIGILLLALAIAGVVIYAKPEQPEPIGAVIELEAVTIESKLVGKTAKQKANIKSVEIAKIDFRGEYVSQKYGVRIDIISIKAFEGGVEIFARAWKISNNKQLGFGDGSVEIERFLIYNPLILVNDPDGDIIREWTEVDIITGESILKQNRLREDPAEATRQEIAHNVTIVGKENTNIIQGKIGNTTSTFFATSDGSGRIGDIVSTSWAALRDASTGTVIIVSGIQQMNIVGEQYTSGGWHIQRVFSPFDTSPIPDGDTVTSATVSYFDVNDSLGTLEIGILQSQQASNTALVEADYIDCGDTANNPTEGATRKTSFTTNAYNDFALNATGLTWISKTGFTLLCARQATDIDDTNPAVARHVWEVGNKDNANPPKLVVEHAVPVVEVTPPQSEFWFD